MISDANWPMERDAFLTSPPPRRVTPAVKKRALSGKGMWAGVVVGTVFFVIGLLLCHFIFPVRLWDEWRLKREPSAIVQGRIVKVERTNTKINDTRVWKHEFTYTAADGVERRGISYRSGERWKMNGRAQVRYLTADPKVAKPERGRLDAAPPALAFVALFPLAGMAMILGAFLSRRSKMKLLRDGWLGSARIEAVEATTTEINGNKVHKIRMRRIDDGTEIVRRSWDDSEISAAFRKKDAGEPVAILYDPKKPKRLILTESWEADSGTSPSRFFEEHPGAKVAGNPPKLSIEAESFIGMRTPRRIPKWLAKRDSAGGAGWFLRIFGLVFLTVGLFASSMMLPWKQPLQWRLDAGPSSTVTGKVVEVVDPKVSINGVSVEGARYSYKVGDGQEMEGLAYRGGSVWRSGEGVKVRYLVSDPSVSVIDGSRMSVGSMGSLFVLIFPAVGAGILFVPMIFAARRKKVLRDGRVATARVTAMKKTNVSVNREPQYAIHLIRDDGVEIVRKSYRPDETGLAARKLESGEPITILSHPMKPERLVFPESW